MSFSLIDKQNLYDGKKLRLEVHHLRDDETEKKHAREIVVHPGAAVVLPIMDDGTVLLIRNFRYAVGQSVLELPAGTLEKGESPMNCAGRELQEETGYLAGRLQPLGWFYTSPGILTERMYAFVGTKLRKSTAALDEGEQIELAPTPYDELMNQLAGGGIVDGKTIATLLMYDRFLREGATPQAGVDDDAPLHLETET